MKRYRNVFILTGVLLVILGISYWDDWQTKKDEKLEKQKNKWANFTVDEVVAFNFSGKEEKDPARPAVTVTLEKKNDQWMMTYPVDAIADQEAVKNFLTTVIDYQYEKSIATGTDKWEEFGLKEPRRSLEISLKGNDKKLVFYVGDKAPVGYSVYVANQGDPNVYLGSQSLDLATAKTATDFRNKTLVEIHKEKIKNISYARAGAPAIKFLKEKGDYKIVAPLPYEADQSVVIDFLEALTNQKISEFMDRPDSKVQATFAKGKRYLDLQIEYEDGSKTELGFAEQGENFLASFNPKQVVFKLDKGFKDKINKKLMDFRDKKMVSFHDEDISRVEIDGNEYIRKKDKWVSKSDEKLEKDHIKNLVSDVVFAKAKEFLPAKELQATQKTPPLHRLKFMFKDDAKREAVVLDVWSDAKKPEVLKVRSSQVAEGMLVEKNVFAHVVEGQKLEDAPDEQADPAAGLEDLSN